MKASIVVRGGGENTRKTVAALVAGMFVLVLALSVPAVNAKPCGERPLVCALEADLVLEPLGWVGTVTGDITGSIVILENPATFTGAIEHFDEDFTITTAEGVTIKGYDLGIFNFNTSKFVANGMVTEVDSPDWQWLVGYQLHESGFVTVLDDGGMHASGTIMLIAP